jgi:hypothetical protein
MGIKNNTRNRADKRDNRSVGIKRYELYKSAISHVQNAQSNGFYIEAITVIESLISDRLESRLSNLLNKNIGFKNLGYLIREIEKRETDDSLRTIVCTDLNTWKEKRNSVIHEMVKLEDDNFSTWEERLKDLPMIAEVGFGIYRKIDNRVQSLQRIR